MELTLYFLPILISNSLITKENSVKNIIVFPGNQRLNYNAYAAKLSKAEIREINNHWTLSSSSSTFSSNYYNHKVSKEKFARKTQMTK